MSNVIAFPSQDGFLIAIQTDENGVETWLLDYHSAETGRIHIGQYPGVMKMTEAMDAYMGIDRPGKLCDQYAHAREGEDHA